MTDGQNPRTVRRPEQIRLLTSPIRQELVDTIVALGGEADVAELAEQLGRPADGLYYHLRALAAGGLVCEMEPENGRGRRFRLPGPGDDPLRLVYDLGPEGNVAELRHFARGLLQVAGRDFDRALERDDVEVSGRFRALWASRNKGWLSRDDLAELNQLLLRLSDLTSQPMAEGRDHLTSLAFVLAPVAPRPKRRRTRRSR